MITPATIAAAEAELRKNRTMLAMSELFLDIMTESTVLYEIGIGQARKVRETNWEGGSLPGQVAATKIGNGIRHAIEHNAVDNGNAGGPAMDAALSGLFDYLSWHHIGAHFLKEEVTQW